jgi:hypothetical protein
MAPVYSFGQRPSGYLVSGRKDTGPNFGKNRSGGSDGQCRKGTSDCLHCCREVARKSKTFENPTRRVESYIFSARANPAHFGSLVPPPPKRTPSNDSPHVLHSVGCRNFYEYSNYHTSYNNIHGFEGSE